MRSIELTKAEQKFLSLALGGKHTMHNGKMSTYMCDGDGKVFTTDGYTVHMITKKKDHARGYYMWNKDAEVLLPLAQDAFNPPDLIKGVLDVRKRHLDELALQEMLPILSFRYGEPTLGLDIDLVMSANNVVGFRKGMFKGELHAVCVGTNYSTLQWQEGVESVIQHNVKDYLNLDGRKLVGAIDFLKSKTMMWRDEISPAFFGDTNGCHALIMPMRLGGVKR